MSSTSSYATIHFARHSTGHIQDGRTPRVVEASGPLTRGEEEGHGQSDTSTTAEDQNKGAGQLFSLQGSLDAAGQRESCVGHPSITVAVKRMPIFY